MDKDISIRRAQKKDCKVIIEMIKALRAHQNFPEDLPGLLTQDTLEADGFGPDPAFKCIIAETSDSTAVGFCLYFRRYSFFDGKRYHVENIYTVPEYRQKSIGSRMLKFVMKEALEEGYASVMLHVLTSNDKALAWYEKIGGVNLNSLLDMQVLNFPKEVMQEYSTERC